MMTRFKFYAVRSQAPLAVVAALLICFAAKIGAEENTAVSSGSNAAAAAAAENAKRLAAGLSSPDYRTREEATQKLSKAGPEAVAEVGKVAGGEDLEAAFRAVRILQSMVLSDDLAVETQAAAILRELAGREPSSTSDLAADALEMHRVRLQERSIARLRQLGAEVGLAGVDYSGVEYPLRVNDYLAITIGAAKWRGNSADFALLKQVPNIYQLSIYGVHVDDGMAAVLSELNHPRMICLFGTGISDSAHESLVKRLPKTTTIDRRGSAFLGVKGVIEANLCEIREISADSPAERAGLMPGDRILTCDGHAVEDFQKLTRLIAAKQAGDSAMLQISRGGNEITKKVTFAEWK